MLMLLYAVVFFIMLTAKAIWTILDFYFFNLSQL